jgi:hypothetical protein
MTADRFSQSIGILSGADVNPFTTLTQLQDSSERVKLVAGHPHDVSALTTVLCGTGADVSCFMPCLMDKPLL